MQLSSLLADLPDVVTLLMPRSDPRGTGQPDKLSLEITGISADSRSVVPGALFVAYQGVDQDGHQYIGDAIARGAAAVVGEKPPSPDPRGEARVGNLVVPYVQVSDGRAALAWLSAAWYGHPSRAMALIGVTGTDGKTTTANLLFSILKAAGRRVGLISTVNAIIPANPTELRTANDSGLGADQVYDTGFHTTTPDAPDVQRYLALMRNAEAEVVVLEATSHGLAQHRLTGCAFDVAVVTNITHEHLDFHGSYEAYLDAKAMLFRSLPNSPRKPGVAKASVLNRDDSSFAVLAAIPVERIVTYGVAGRFAAPAPSQELDREKASPSQHLPRQPRGTPQAREVSSRDVRSLALTAVDVRNTSSGTAFDVELSSGELAASKELWSVSTPLIGMFNVYNILAASAAALALGVDVPAIQAGVQSLVGVPGRMERVDRGQGFAAVVDFAHTPNALAQALETARDYAVRGGRVIAVFGCAGLRDRQKRRLMGEVAARLADITVITAEDPRTEDLDAVMAEIAAALVAGGQSEGSDFVRVADRQLAVLHAVRQARSGDVVIVCGKGHERSMCFGVTEYPWGDREALAWALDLEMGRSAPPPFVLPTWEPL